MRDVRRGRRRAPVTAGAPRRARARWRVVVTSAAPIVALLVLAPALHEDRPPRACPGSAPPPGVYVRATAAVPYIGNGVSGMPIGHLLRGSVRVQRVRCKRGVEFRWYGYGAITYGHFGRWGAGGRRCGWVRVVRDREQPVDFEGEAPALLARAAAPTRQQRCRTPSRTAGGLSEEQILAAGTWRNGSGEGTTQAAAITRDCPVYANYDPAPPGRFLDRQGTEIAGRGTRGVPGFGTRYMTRDRRAVLIKDTALPTRHHTKWYFIAARCVSGAFGR